MGRCEDGQFNVGTSVLQGASKGSLGLEKIKKQVDELVRSDGPAWAEAGVQEPALESRT